MFNNIVYFVLVLLIYTVSYPGKISNEPLLFDFFTGLISWAGFAGYCRWRFSRILTQMDEGLFFQGRLTARYYRTVFILSVLSIILFTVDVYLLNLRYWITEIPGVSRFSSLEGLLALSVFFVYLCTIWYFACPVYRNMFHQQVSRRVFIRSNIQLNIPILFPWIGISLVFDLIALSPWAGPDGMLKGLAGNIFLYSVFVLLLVIYMPAVIQFWWRCKPLAATEKADAMKTFLEQQGFKYRGLLQWPIFQGRMMTAGIMGIVPRYRYILITDALMEILTVDELKAVLAHEMGHAKYRHLLFYILFFLAFAFVFFGFQDILQETVFLSPFFFKMLSSNDPQSITLFYLLSALPLLLVMVLYFRFLMGFFMRNFERQADLYSARVMGGPEAIVRSLEKIADCSGKSRDLPSWHHFSISRRAACLIKTRTDPTVFTKHNRFLAISFLAYLAGMSILGYTLNFSPLKKHLVYSAQERILSERLTLASNQVDLLEAYAMVCQVLGKEEKAIDAYEKAIALDPHRASALNNLAWILVTTSSNQRRNPSQGLTLALQAVSLDRSAVFLDTLAEAYYVNGLVDPAIETIKEAISAATENKSYYEGQLKKFLSGSQVKG